MDYRAPSAESFASSALEIVHRQVRFFFLPSSCPGLSFAWLHLPCANQHWGWNVVAGVQAQFGMGEGEGVAGSVTQPFPRGAPLESGRYIHWQMSSLLLRTGESFRPPDQSRSVSSDWDGKELVVTLLGVGDVAVIRRSHTHTDLSAPRPSPAKCAGQVA
jgi:hypothetical protein